MKAVKSERETLSDRRGVIDPNEENFLPGDHTYRAGASAGSGSCWRCVIMIPRVMGEELCDAGDVNVGAVTTPVSV